MKKKTILISGIVIILVAIGIFILLRKAIIVPVEEEPTPPEAETEAPAETPEEERPEEEPAEIVGLSSCVVLDEEHCKQGEPLCGDPDVLPIGFNLLSGTKIYAPFDGVLYVDKMILENGQETPIIELMEWPIGEVMHEFLFHDIIPNPELLKELEEGSERVIDITEEEWPEGPVIRKRVKVKKGELIGKVSADIYLSFFGKEHNLVIFIDNTRDLPPYTAEHLPEFYIDMDFLQQYFPYIKECKE